MKGNVAAIVLIAFGTFFLLSNLGLINVSLAELFKTWWPGNRKKGLNAPPL